MINDILPAKGRGFPSKQSLSALCWIKGECRLCFNSSTRQARGILEAPNKKIFIVHGWDGGSDKDWMPWAKRELEQRGHEVHLLSMPDPGYPRINTWVEYLRKEVGKPDENTILVGHSMGCQTILRYLETLQEDEKVDRVVLVAGFGQYLTGLTEEEKTVTGPWVENPIDFEKVKAKADSFVALFSNNDPFVPLKENSRLFEEKLGARIVVQKNKGHFMGDEGITELPVLLELVC